MLTWGADIRRRPRGHVNSVIHPKTEIILAAVLFSTGGAVIKACSFSSWQIAGFRSGLAVLVLLLLLPRARQRWSGPDVLVGLAYAATMMLFVAANKLTTSANTIFIQYTAPLYILLLSPWLLNEAICLRDAFLMAVIVSGLVLLLMGHESPQRTSPDPLAGNLLAALSGISWALTIMGLRWLGKRRERADVTLSAVVIGNLITSLFCLPLAFPLENSTLTNWLAVCYLGVFQIGLAYLFLTHGLALVPAFTASILLLVEPVLNPVWAFLVHREVPSFGAICGGILIIGATVLKTRSSQRPVPPPSRLHRVD